MDYVDYLMPLARYKPRITADTPARAPSFNMDGTEVDIHFMVKGNRKVVLSLSRKEALELMKDLDTFIVETEETYGFRNTED